MAKPLLITRGIVIFPSTTKSIEVGREQSIKSIEKAWNSDKEIIIVSQIDPIVDEPKLKDIYNVGVICKIKKLHKNNDGSYLAEFKASKRIKILDFGSEEDQSATCDYKPLKDKNIKNEYNNKIVKDIIDLLNSTLESGMANELQNLDLKSLLKDPINPSKLADILANNLLINLKTQQNILEELDVSKRLDLIVMLTLKELDDGSVAANVDSKINKKINDNLSKQQKEFYLRERLRAIKEELGELSTKDVEIDKIKAKIAEFPYPENIKEKIKSELNKYEAAMSSNEASIIKSYIDWLVDLPWWQEEKDDSNIKHVEKILERNHYGLEKVKERILEYLAIRTKNKNMRGPILCLVGPPGVGKTSLALSIAEALNKKYVKISLGGIRDEAEIRGHRKTYIGAMPGRIIKGMKKSGVINPLFLLDEIDKMANDHRGDPASAMLEVLDPEQNNRFSDNYIEEEYDLSKVMFIATANYYNQIPYALIDRLEVIELSSYTANEKREIAKTHLLQKVFEEAAMSKKDLPFSDESLDYIISHYTREAGVRELERQIRQIVRKHVVAELKGKKVTNLIGIDEVKKYLGKEKFDPTLKEKTSIPGIVNGMAYTSAGGDLLPIEASYSKGKGKIVVTGNLEQTMKESVSVALGYVKANAKHFGIDEDKFQSIDIHVHVPAGGIPKDGPSAGVALTSALISVLKNQSVPTNISMTGEITLRGRVGIIGGVKEKVISAHRAGVREIFLPAEDERFLVDIPKEILKDIKIHLIEHYDEIFKKLFNN